MVASKTVPYKSGKIGGIHFSGQKKWRKKCVNDENPEFLTSNSQSKARFRVISQEFGGKSKKIGGSLTTRF